MGERIAPVHKDRSLGSATSHRLLVHLLLLGLALAACDHRTTEETSSKEGPATPVDPHLKRRCFLGVTKGIGGSQTDSVSVQLTINDSSGHVTGRLDGSAAGVDRTHGTLVGQLIGDRVLAIYTYQAGDTTLTEQRILLLGDDHVSVITAAMEELGGKWRMKHAGRSEEGLKAAEVSCP